jgi:hypothetical protein
MGAYTDDDKDSDAALLDSLEGVVRADTKRMLARVADDDEVPVALLRRMALKAGATLDCFVKMHRKKRRAVELTDKHAIVRQLLRPKGAVRLAGAERLGRESGKEGTQKQSRKRVGGALVGVTGAAGAGPTAGQATVWVTLAAGLPTIVPLVVKMSPVPLDPASEQLIIRGTIWLLAALLTSSWRSGRGEEKGVGVTNTDVEIRNTIKAYLQTLDEQDIQKLNEYTVRQTLHITEARYDPIIKEEITKAQNDIRDKQLKQKLKTRRVELQSEMRTKRFKEGIEKNKVRKLQGARDVNSVYTEIAAFATSRAAKYSFYAALLTAAGALLYYLAPYFDDDEYDDDDRSTSEWDPETDPEVRLRHAHPFVRLAQRGAKTRAKLRKHFHKHPMFTLGFTTAALFTAYAYRTHTRNKQLAQLLLGLADAPADRVHLTSYVGESYADTGECLRRVDPALHEVFVKYDAPDAAHALAKVYYHVVRAQHKRQQAVFVSDRAVLNAHLIRTDGTFRDSLGEIARAIAYHWKARNLLSIGWTRAKRTLRLGRKRKTVRRRSGSRSTEATTHKKTHKKTHIT